MEKTFRGWETYPENVACAGACGEICDYPQYRRELENEAARIFHEEKIDVKVFELGKRKLLLSTLSELEGLIAQEYSWSHLSITFDGLRRLCTSLAVFPHFINILRAFGQKTEACNDTFSAFNAQRHARANSLELSYIIKHVEKRERHRENLHNRWSFRQIGVYHKLREDSGSSIIILNPPKVFCRRLNQMHDSENTRSCWNIVMLLLTFATQQWIWCLSDLEHRFTLTKRKAQLPHVAKSSKEPSSVPASDLCAEDAQDIQVLQDYSLQLCQFLDIDCDVLSSLEQYEPRNQDSASTLQSLTRNVKEQSKRAQGILRRVDSLVALVQTLLDLQGLHRLEVNGELMIEMTHASRQESRTILELSRKASWDSDILKTITFLTLVYLPASFCTSMMDMGYINIERNRGKPTIVFEDEFNIFLVVTAVLWTLTLGSYFWLVHSKKKANKREAEHVRESILEL